MKMSATEKYDELDEEATTLRAMARRLRDEGDIGLAAETDAEAAQLEAEMEDIMSTGMSPEEQGRYWY